MIARSMQGTTKRSVLRGIAALAAATLTATAASAQECKNPNALSFSIIPTEETIQELTLYKPLIDHLSKKTGKKIEFYMPTSYASVVEAMLSGWVHIGVHGPNSYVLANNRDPKLQVFATYAKQPGHIQKEGPGYAAVLISKKGSGLDSIEKLKGKVLGLVDPASTSGDLLPRVAFTKEIAGQRLEDYFSRVVYTGEHDLSTMAVHEGKVDAAFVATHRFDNVIDRGMVKMDDFHFIWESPPVPQDPFVYDTRLCEDLKKAIRETFLEIHTVPEAKTFLANVKSNRFVEMKDSDYDIIRELQQAKTKK